VRRGRTANGVGPSRPYDVRLYDTNRNSVFSATGSVTSTQRINFATTSTTGLYLQWGTDWNVGPGLHVITRLWTVLRHDVLLALGGQTTTRVRRQEQRTRGAEEAEFEPAIEVDPLCRNEQRVAVPSWPMPRRTATRECSQPDAVQRSLSRTIAPLSAIPRNPQLFATQ